MKAEASGKNSLSRHDGRSRLVLGQLELAKTTSGSRSEVSDVVGDLHEGNGDDIESAGRLDNGVVSGKSLKLQDAISILEAITLKGRSRQRD